MTPQAVVAAKMKAGKWKHMGLEKKGDIDERKILSCFAPWTFRSPFCHLII